MNSCHGQFLFAIKTVQDLHHAWKFLLIPIYLLGQQAYSQTKWTVDTTSITFQIKNAGILVNGSFEGLVAHIKFDPDELDDSHIMAQIDAQTIKTGIRLRDKHLRQWDYLDVEQYPRIALRSTTFKKNLDNNFVGSFLLDLKGRQELIEIPFNFVNNGDRSTFEGTFQINRQDFEIGDESLILADTIQVKVWVQTTEEN